MKKHIFTPLLFLTALFISSCEEKLVIITPINSSGPTDLTRRVLAEELTGVRCPNCPEGTAALISLGKQHGDALVIVSIHAALGYDTPYPESKYDFRTPAGTEIGNFIGAATFFPSAAINRRIVPPETEPYLSRTFWAGIIDEERAKPLEIDLALNTTFNSASRQLDVSVDLKPLVDLTSTEHRLTIVITQDSIQDYQKVNLDKVSDYYHRHVLRRALTQPTGNIITESLTSGATVTKTFTTQLPATWVEKHCSVVAFVHHGVIPDKEVLQAVEAHVVK